MFSCIRRTSTVNWVRNETDGFPQKCLMDHAAAMGCYLGSKGGCPSPAPAVSHNVIHGTGELLTTIVRTWTAQRYSSQSIVSSLILGKSRQEMQMGYTQG